MTVPGGCPVGGSQLDDLHVVAVGIDHGPEPGAGRLPVLQPGQPRPGYATLARDRPFLILTGLNSVYALSSMMLALAIPTVVLLGLGGPSWVTSVILAGNTVLIAVLSVPVGSRLSGRRRTRGIVAAAGLWAVWSLVLAVLPEGAGWVVPALVASTLLFTAAELIHAPLSQALAAAAAPPQVRGRYLATFQYSFTFASIAAPAFFTTLFELDPAAPWLVLAAVNAASIAGMLYLERVLPPAAVRETAGR